MRLQELTHELAASGHIHIDRHAHTIMVIDDEGVAAFPLENASRDILVRFKRAAEEVTGLPLPRGLIGLRLVLAALCTG